MGTVLLSGFEPFAGAAVNSSWDAVSELARGRPELHTVLLPVEFGRGWQVLREEIEALRPDVVIAVGLAEDRAAITPERFAVNLQDARIPDNGGAQPHERPVAFGGPVAHDSGLPVSAIVDALRAAGLPAAPSLSAGAYVCNDVFYRLRDATRIGEDAVPAVAGFIHVPSGDTIAVAELARGLGIAVDVTQDLANQGG